MVDTRFRENNRIDFRIWRSQSTVNLLERSLILFMKSTGGRQKSLSIINKLLPPPSEKIYTIEDKFFDTPWPYLFWSWI